MSKKFEPTSDDRAFFEQAILEVAEPETAQRNMPFSQEEVASFQAQASDVNLPSAPPPWWKSYPAAAVKGLVEGVSMFGKAFGPSGDLTPQQIQQNDQTRRQVLDQYLPSDSEGFVENTLERTGKILPSLAAGGGAAGGTILRSLLGGASGATAQSLGAPEWAQSLAELPAQIAPGFGNRVIPNRNQQNLVQDARRLGLTEQELTPLIQSNRKQYVLSKIAARRGKTREALSDSYDAVKRVYGELSARPDAKAILNAQQSSQLVADMQNLLSKMPNTVRKKIGKDMQDLVNSPMSGEEIINFYQDVNYYVGRGNRQLGLLKEPITKALATISPTLATDFNTTNTLYSKYHQIAKQLKPNAVYDLVSLSEAGRFLFGTFTGNFPLLLETVGEVAAKKMASELLVNPRFQNLSKQMVSAINNSKYSVAQNLLDKMISLASEVSPEAAYELQKVDLTQLNQRSRNGTQQ